jgi:hypothetical protein
MNTCEPNMRFHFIDGFLDSFSCGLGRVRGRASKASFILVMLLLVLPMLFPWEILIIFLMIALVLFLELIFCGMFLRETERLHFWSKFCILLTSMISWVHLCVSKSCVPKYLPTNPLESKTRTSPLSLSLLSHVGWRFWDGEHELWRSQSFAWSDWDTDGSQYPCS